MESYVALTVSRVYKVQGESAVKWSDTLVGGFRLNSLSAVTVREVEIKKYNSVEL